MKRLATMVVLVVVGCAVAVAQYSVTAQHDVIISKNKPGVPDSLKPYLTDQGVRSVWVTNDLDKDGKPEVIATDYTNRGRVHVFEMTSPTTLELVWSSPRLPTGGGSTPRWVRSGDLDGDGKGEIIYPNSTTAGADTQILVFQWSGKDNDYGTTPTFRLPMNYFVPQGTLNFRMNREVGDVYDYDGDGKDELITVNRDNRTYILGVSGDFASGFATWQLEGGDPAVVTERDWMGGSQWHSIAADIDGDGKKEIVNHRWNYWGLWSIDPVGPDSYRYPKPKADSLTNPGAAKKWHYREYTRPWNADAVAYMGIQAVDVNGDGAQEIAGIIYTGSATIDYDMSLTAVAKGDTGVYVWKDSTQFGLIGQDLWTQFGKSTGDFWGLSAYDFNGNGRGEIYIGATYPYEVIRMEYKGSGSIVDKSNYTVSLAYGGVPGIYGTILYRDSLGAKRDTIRNYPPFISKMFAGCDLDKNGKKEIVSSFQDVYDTLTVYHQRWDSTTGVKKYVNIDTIKTPRPNGYNIKVLEYQGPTGFQEKEFAVVTPEDYKLEQNYPNPFNPSTEIRFSLPVDKRVSLTVFDVAGREVRTLVNDESYKKGTHSVTWNGTDAKGRPVASGTYFATLKHGNFSKSIKMMLVK